MRRWLYTQKQKNTKVKWSKNQTTLLATIINKCSGQNGLPWKKISEELNQVATGEGNPKRSAFQCRERWMNCLVPGLRREKFTLIEDIQML